jgi:hypothetical protein
VVPAYVTGTNCLRSAFLRRKRLAVSFGEPVEPARFAAGDDHRRYEDLTEEVMKRIEDLAREAAA